LVSIYYFSSSFNSYHVLNMIAKIAIYKTLHESILLPSFFITLVFKHDFIRIDVEFLHFLISFQIKFKLIFYVSLDLYMLTIYVISRNVTSTTKMLSKLGRKCFEVFWIVLHSFDDRKNFLATSFKFENMNLSIGFLNFFGLLHFFFTFSCCFFLFSFFNNF